MQDKPRAFRISPSDETVGAPVHTTGGLAVETTPDAFEQAKAELDISLAPRRRAITWLRLFAAGAGGLALLAIGASVQSFIAEQIRTYPPLGYLALGLTLLALAGLVGFLLREAFSVWRAVRVEQLARDVAIARASDDLAEGRRLARSLVALYSSRPETARGRVYVEEIEADLVDARGRLDIVERELLAPLDVKARAVVATAASRVALITTISPRALVDVLFVLGASVRLIRQVSEIYGGRPGLLGFLRVGRHVLTHLTVTGGIALGEGLAQQILGAGLAARLSAKLGEGVVNGLLTARVGLSAIKVCRPMNFVALPTPTLSDIASGFLNPERARSSKET